MENEPQNSRIEPVEKAADSLSPPSAPVANEAEVNRLREKIIEVARTCFDPEIPVNIYDLGLVYEIKIEPSLEVSVKMTLTSPACPSVFSLPGEVEDKIRRLGVFKDVQVQVVWDPPWTTERISEAAKLQLGLM